MATPDSYEMCCHPAWSTAACHKCESCRVGFERLRRIENAAHNVVAVFESDAHMLEPALKELRASLDMYVISNN